MYIRILGEYIKVKLVASLLHSVPFAPCLSFICIRRETQRNNFPYLCGHVLRGSSSPVKTKQAQMAVKIRLARRGRKKMAMYDIVVAESTSPRDGRFIEKIGSYNPNTDPSTVVLKSERAVHWLMVGAMPTDTARSVLSHEGIMYRKHLQVGVNKGAITQDQADEKYTTWKDEKQNRKDTSADTKTQTKEQARAARLEAEKKVNEARAEAIAKKNKVEEPVAEVASTPAAPAEQTDDVAPVAEAAPVAETPAPEAAAPEAPVAEEAAPVDAAPTDVAPTDATALDETPVAEEAAPTDVAPMDATPAAETDETKTAE
jgi:small subunit ribosomal protein S16